MIFFCIVCFIHIITYLGLSNVCFFYFLQKVYESDLSLVKGKWMNWLTFIIVALFASGAAADRREERDHVNPIIVRQGDNITIQFFVSCPPLESSGLNFHLYLYPMELPVPFATNGKLNKDGFKQESQMQRFNVKSRVSNRTLSVNLTINSVSLCDQGVYRLLITLYTPSGIQRRNATRAMEVVVPPGAANCSVRQINHVRVQEITCIASVGNRIADISCFQNGMKNTPRADVISIRNDNTIERVYYVAPETFCTLLRACLVVKMWLRTYAMTTSGPLQQRQLECTLQVFPGISSKIHTYLIRRWILSLHQDLVKSMLYTFPLYLSSFILRWNKCLTELETHCAFGMGGINSEIWNNCGFSKLLYIGFLTA